MNPEYALFLLKDKKRQLDEKILGMNELEDMGEKIHPPARTKYKHQVASLDFAIEIIEEYQENDA